MLIVMVKSTPEEHLSQPLQTNIKQFKIAVSFLTGYNGIFNVTNSIDNFHFAKSIADEAGFIQISILPGADEIEKINNEIKWIIIDEDHFTEANYPFLIKPTFSTVGSTIKNSSQGVLINFPPDDSIRNLLGSNATTLYEEYNLSPNRVDILPFNNIFIKTDIAQGMVYKKTIWNYP